MKKIRVILAVIIVGAGLLLLLKSMNVPPGDARIAPASAANSTGKSSGPPGTPAVPANDSTISMSAPAGNPEATQTSSPALVASASGAVPASTEISPLPPLTVLDIARVAMHNYNAAFGENPVGDNSEITAALTGKNPKQTDFITEESGLRVNAKGEMIDAWGTPFFFHQLSGQVMEIRSAGEDRKLWTSDDQVTR